MGRPPNSMSNVCNIQGELLAAFSLSTERTHVHRAQTWPARGSGRPFHAERHSDDAGPRAWTHRPKLSEGRSPLFPERDEAADPEQRAFRRLPSPGGFASPPNRWEVCRVDFYRNSPEPQKGPTRVSGRFYQCPWEGEPVGPYRHASAPDTPAGNPP